MTDLSRVLPDFPVARYARLLPAIERHGLTVADLLTLDAPDIGRRARLPLLDVQRLCRAVLAALHDDLGVAGGDGDDDVDAGGQDGGGKVDNTSSHHHKHKHNPDNNNNNHNNNDSRLRLRHTGAELAAARPWRAISTLDPALDAALGGGVAAGRVTEVAGESGAGKTQLLLTLLLAAQLPPPRGLGRPALYISTEAPLPTRRLAQILERHPALRASGPEAETEAEPDSKSSEQQQQQRKQQQRQYERPSLDRVLSAVTPDLESQDHILTYQVPVEVARRNVGLLVLDSVAANYRVEFERGGGGANAETYPTTGAAAGGDSSRRRVQAGSNNLAARGGALVRLGALLQDLARRHDLAVVVANQVADRFPGPGGGGGPSPLFFAAKSGSNSAAAAPPLPPPSSALSSSGMPPPPPDAPLPLPQPPALLLDHQQRWFTGWGDEPFPGPAAAASLKTPSLGLVWATQVAARVALLRRPAYGPTTGRRRYSMEEEKENEEQKEDEDEEADGGAAVVARRRRRSWRRWMKVVFAPHVPAAGPGLDGAVEFEITAAGLRGVGVAAGNSDKARRRREE
ncbi:DNA repair protein RAD57 [Xylariaceae sp. FL0804]|nr:DNA repair protein RAD57 [Xylariaceae sp. FL0804]